MAEAEELLAEGAELATRFAQELWKRHARTVAVARLSDVRERIQCFVTGIRGACPPLALADPPLQRSLFGRLAHRIPRHLMLSDALPATDGQRILLPRELQPTTEDPSGIRRFRLYALVQAARIDRETAAHAPSDPLERDLFIALDGAAALRNLSHDLPYVAPDIERSIERSLAARPAIDRLTPLERAVEHLVRASLHDLSPTEPEGAAGIGRALSKSVRETAASLRASFEGRYRGLPGAESWGELVATRTSRPVGGQASSVDASIKPPPAATLSRRPTPRRAEPGEDDERPGMFILKADASHQSVEDPLGLVRPHDEGQVDLAALSDALAELADATLTRAPGKVREILLSEEAKLSQAAHGRGAAPNHRGFAYPEWDYRTLSYRRPGAIVRESAAALGDADWVERALRRQAPLVNTLCASFAHLRPTRSRLRRQADGAEVDVDAYVTAFADRLAGSCSDDGLYEESRPRRRDFAVLLLIDASASTDASIRGRERIIDVEKDALLLVCKALEQLGDRYAAYGFSGETAGEVSMRAIKRFEDRYDSIVERRISGLEPDRYTRLGAALRHGASLLAGERARHRLLLVVSDGKPNDVDEYEGRYGVEDTRQAIIEARMQHLEPFCITVDREAPQYARHVFGPNGYALLREARMLPQTLLSVLRQLVTS